MLPWSKREGRQLRRAARLRAFAARLPVVSSRSEFRSGMVAPGISVASGGYHDGELTRMEHIGPIETILFPVDFSPSCAAMAAYVKRAAAIFRARVTLVHVFDLTGHNGFELYVRPLSEIAQEHRELARARLDSFLQSEVPIGECPRILLSGDVATEIAQLARTGGFDLVVMPTHAGAFRRMLLGPYFSKTLITRSRKRKVFRQQMALSFFSNSSRTPGRKSSCRLKPSGAGRRGLCAWTIDSATTMARVQEDIWYTNLPRSVISGGTEGTCSRG